jgi:hypothetical protein
MLSVENKTAPPLVSVGPKASPGSLHNVHAAPRFKKRIFAEITPGPQLVHQIAELLPLCEHVAMQIPVCIGEVANNCSS